MKVITGYVRAFSKEYLLRKEESAEIRSERRDHLADYPFVEFAQYTFDRRPVDDVWRTFAERYEEGRGLLHVHFRVNSGGREVPHNFCAAFNHAPGGLGIEDAAVTRDIQADGFGAKGNHIGKSMLVLGRKDMKYRQGVQTRLFPSLVRLQFLDDCLRVWVDAPNFIAAFVGPHGPVGGDRKLQHSSAMLGQWVDSDVGGREVVNEVIEGRTHVVQTVSNNEAEFQRHRLQEFSYKQLLAALYVEIVDQLVWLAFEPGSDFAFKALQVIEHPV